MIEVKVTDDRKTFFDPQQTRSEIDLQIVLSNGNLHRTPAKEAENRNTLLFVINTLSSECSLFSNRK